MAQSHNITSTDVESNIIPVYETIGDRTSEDYDDIEMQPCVSNVNVNVENDEEKLPDKKHKIVLKKNVCIGTIVVITVLVIVSAVVAYVFLSPKTQGGSCKSYTDISNGQIVRSTGSRHGDTLEFQCDKNSKLIGTNTITCLSSDVWSADPHCVLKECGKFVLTQHMAARSDANLTTIGSVISLFCEKGFQLSGNSSVICQTDEEWSTSPTCKHVDCGSPMVIRNAKQYRLKKTPYNSSFTVECADGYTLIGTETVTCNIDGRWDDLPMCEIMSCGIPNIPVHASIRNLTGTSFQSTVTLKCDEGYSMHGNSESSCTSSGNWTDLPSCKAKDFCESSPFQNGSCVSTKNNYTCICSAGFWGSHCGKTKVDGGWSSWEDWGSCSVSCGTGMSSRNRTCDHPVPQGSGVQCPGISLENKLCFPGSCSNSCQSHPCHYGNCRPKGDSFKCLCFLGYTGLYCENEIDECAMQPCLNGSCSDLVNGYSCSCFAGFSGIHCQTEINECVSNPCLHGTCTDLVNGHNCTCFAGYSGLDCQTEINECVSSPCLYGTCTDLVNGYNCTCFPGYSGLDCQTEINECVSNPCLYGTCTDLVNGYNCTCFAGYSGLDCKTVITDCVDILRYNGSSSDGIYTVRTWKSHQLINVYCDMTTDGGGWTVFQNRFDGSIDFYRNFSEYEGGFGNLTTEFWLGLRNIKEIADQDKTDLRIDLEAANGTKAYETSNNFYLSPGPAYTLHIGSTLASLRISSIGSSVGQYHNGSDFSTYDRDADFYYSGNCAFDGHGAWWYKHCELANLNGQYLTPGTNNIKSMRYYTFMYSESLKTSRMMMRRE